ncbi:MAG: FtsX-like permease family protein, partial [bacterium]|nr:FtsX-like permease family protein [bacterium]
MNRLENKNSNSENSSKVAFWLIERIIPLCDHTSVYGDFEELFEAKFQEKGRNYAGVWLWFQILKSTPKFIKKSIFWSKEMFKNYFKIAYRNILKYKVYSLINISGLAIGIAASFLIMLFVFDELSYDKYHEKADRIYRICARGLIGDTKIDQAWTPAPLPTALMEDFPEVENAVRLAGERNVTIRYGDRVLEEPMIMRADSTLFKVFSFELIQGDPAAALKKPFTAVISRTAADKYFQGEEAMGKIIAVDDRLRFTITGIMEDIPRNSHFHFDVAVSLSTYSYSRNPNWMSNNFKDYLVLKEGYPFKELEKKFPEFIQRRIGQGREDWLGKGNYWEYYLQPLTDIHLNSNLSGELEPNGNIAYVYIFSIVAIFIILIASINFMNLTTAKSATRAKEVGIRKVVGSNKAMLIRQFLCESVLLSMIALVIAVVLINVSLPFYRNLIGSPIEVDFLGNYFLLPLLTVFTLTVGIVSGLYPSIFLSAFKPVSVIKGIHGKGKRKGFNLRNGLVVFQFAISIFLILGTFIVYRQLQFFQNKSLGFEKESILVLKEPMRLGENFNTFKEKLLQSSEITGVSYSTTLPGTEHNNWYITPEALPAITLNFNITDQDFLDVMKMEMSEGRYFSREFGTDSTGIIINETAAGLLGWDDPIG